MTLHVDIPDELPSEGVLFLRLKLVAHRVRDPEVLLTAHTQLERDEDTYLGSAVCWDLPPTVVPSSLRDWVQRFAHRFLLLSRNYLGGGKWLSPESDNSAPPWEPLRALTAALSEALDCGLIARRWKAADWISSDPQDLLHQVGKVHDTFGAWALTVQRNAQASGAVLDVDDLICTARGKLFHWLSEGIRGERDDGGVTIRQLGQRAELRRVLGLD